MIKNARSYQDPRLRRKSVLLALLARMWVAGMLAFALDADIDARLVSGMFPVHKSADRDRLVSNRRPRNAVEQRIGAAAELFPHGCMFTELLVGARARVRGSGDDLPDFYHTVKVSSARARSNAFGRPVRFRDVAHLAAARRLREQRPDIQDNTLIRALQATLPMGDTNATDYGQLAHLGVLREGEALDESAYVSYREPAAGWGYMAGCHDRRPHGRAGVRKHADGAECRRSFIEACRSGLRTGRVGAEDCEAVSLRGRVQRHWRED